MNTEPALSQEQEERLLQIKNVEVYIEKEKKSIEQSKEMIVMYETSIFNSNENIKMATQQKELMQKKL